MAKHEIPKALWSSDNDWGIPTLRADLCSDALDLPVVQWGTRCRKAYMNGTWSFYVDDYRFNYLWRDSSTVMKSGCINVIEPNFSIFNYTAPAEAMYQIYKKRYLARTWQEMAGIKVIVDMNVPLEFQEMNLLGVPRGWRSYATRGYTDRLEDLEEEYRIAKNHAESDYIQFVVYGGGNRVKQWTKEHTGVIWVTEQQDLNSGNKRRSILSD